MDQVDSKLLKGGYKKDEKKVRFDLLAWDAIEECAKVMTAGAVKYDEYNWAKGMAWHRPARAAFNHGQFFWRGRDRDPETGLLHPAHAMCNNMFLTAYLLRGGKHLHFDDRPHKMIERAPATPAKCVGCLQEIQKSWTWCAWCGRAQNN